jgi:hypothetical protein
MYRRLVVARILAIELVEHGGRATGGLDVGVDVAIGEGHARRVEALGSVFLVFAYEPSEEILCGRFVLGDPEVGEGT